MKRRIINGFLVAATLLTGAVSLQSCKDTDEDLRVELQNQNLDLQGKIDALTSLVGQLKQAQEACKSECAAKYAELVALINKAKDESASKEEVAAMRDSITTVASDLASLTTLNNKLQDQVDIIEGSLSTLTQSVTDQIERVDGIESLVNSCIVNIQNLSNIVAGLKNYDDTELRQRIEALEARMTGVETKAQDGVDALKWINENKDRLTNLETIVAGLSNYDDTELRNLIAALQLKDTDLENQINQAIADYKAADTELANALRGEMDQQKADLESKIADLEQRLDAKIGDVQTNLDNAIAQFTQVMTELNQRMENAEEAVSVLVDTMTEVQTAVGELQESYDALENRVAANEAAIKQIKGDIATINSQIAGLQEQLAKMVTSVIIQGTENPIFGTFSAPVGISSNCLVLYYGEAANQVTFPAFGSSRNEYDGEIRLTSADKSMVGNVPTDNFSQGQILVADDYNNAGRVYMTINPNTVDFQGLDLTLVSSQDNQSGITLKNVRRSNKELTFGVSRADNGFYEADAFMAPGNVGMNTLNLDPGFKHEMKEYLKGIVRDHSKSDLAELVKVLYRQLDGIATCYGLKAAYEFDGKIHSVVSNYDMLNTSLKPLSFKFLYGESFDNRMPEISPLNDFKLNIDLALDEISVKPIEIDGISFDIEFTPIQFTYEGTMALGSFTLNVTDDAGNVIGHIDYNFDPNDPNSDKPIIVDPDDFDNFIKDFTDEINNQINEHWSTDVKAAIDKYMQQIIDKVNDAIQETVDDLTGQINDQIQDAIDQINQELNDKLGSYFDRFNSLIDKYNRLRDKVSDILSNPNHYLQTMIVYKGADGELHHMSSVKKYPSAFAAKGGNSIMLYPTTYTAEVIAPSFRKYLAITNVYAPDGSSAQSGNATCRAMLDDANANSALLNKPVKGQTHRVAVKVDPSKTGYVYELAYSALDYHGYTSTHKYFFTVK